MDYFSVICGFPEATFIEIPLPVHPFFNEIIEIIEINPSNFNNFNYFNRIRAWSSLSFLLGSC